MIAAIYARKSTEQAGVDDEDKSVARQVEHARAYAREQAWTVDEHHIYIDDGVSGAEFENRPGLMRLLNTLKTRAPFDVLVMANQSRLGRDTIRTGYALLQIVEAGVRVFFYLEKREATLDGPVEQMVQSLNAFASHMQREQARQFTIDALTRKARSAFVTGGRCFGYDNVDVLSGIVDAGGRAKRSHVERRINEAEANVIRRIFRMAADGVGRKRIAQLLNTENAPMPKPHQGRVAGWSASTVYEVLHRELYRGQVIYGRTTTRKVRGKLRQVPQPESDWIRVSAPQLRIVDEDLWQSAHARLEASSKLYLRRTDGKLWGRPQNAIEAKYLLTGLLQCGKCGGPLEVRSRRHGRRRVNFYMCSTHRRRGREHCLGLDVPMDRADVEVLNVLEARLMKPAVLRQALAQVIAESTEASARGQSSRQELLRRRSELDVQLQRLTDLVADGGDSPALLMAIKAREAQRERLDRELAQFDHASPATTPAALAAMLDERLKDWTALLRSHAPLARQMLRKILVGRLTIIPETRDEQPGYRIRGKGTVAPLINVVLQTSGARGVDSPSAENHKNRSGLREDAQGVASPIYASWNQLDGWLRQVEGLRQVA